MPLDGRSPLSSADSDDSSGAESPPPSVSISNSNMVEHKHPSTSTVCVQPETPSKMSSSVISSTAGGMPQLQSGLGSVLYPAAALANLPQDVLFSLVQAGHLQFRSNEDGAHQYITIPLATTTASTPPALATLSSIKEEHSANGRHSPVIIKKETVE
uniref:Uncharacterized protein n=1 Tax=Lutzomyia longipalpis TaxID=7200 RepID=A0A1B0CJX5_LUTLO